MLVPDALGGKFRLQLLQCDLRSTAIYSDDDIFIMLRFNHAYCD